MLRNAGTELNYVSNTGNAVNPTNGNGKIEGKYDGYGYHTLSAGRKFPFSSTQNFPFVLNTGLYYDFPKDPKDGKLYKIFMESAAINPDNGEPSIDPDMGFATTIKRRVEFY